MKRRTFIGSTGASLAALTTKSMAAEKNEKLVSTPAVIMAPRHDGAEIVWGVTRLARGAVEWRDESGATGVFRTDDFGFTPQNARVLKVKLRGLKSGQTYEIRTLTEAIDGSAEKVESPWKSFRTLAEADHSECHFVVWNDTHEHDDTIKKLHEITPKADFLVWNGDTCNNWNREDQLTPILLHPGGCDITNGRPLLLTMGNHDVRGKHAFQISDHIATPENRPYCAFRNGPVAVILLNTGEDKPDDHPSFSGRASFQKHREEQAAWLKEVIARPEIKNAPHKIVFCHLPLRGENEIEKVDYAGGDWDRYARSSRDLWHESLVAWGAQVVISGHTHRQNWIPANADFPYAQLVGGGPKEDNARFIEGKVDGEMLKFTVRDLRGKITFEQKFPRV